MSTLKIPVNSNDHHLGNVHAGITLVKYGDYQCPSCRLAHSLVKRLLKEKGDEVHFVFRHFPLRKFHRHAQNAAITAEAAGKQGKFWEMHDLIFGNQEKLNTKYLMSLAAQLDLDAAQFAKDSESKDITDKIRTDLQNGVRSGVHGTPAFFLNDQLIESYDNTYESLLDAIQKESAKIASHN